MQNISVYGLSNMLKELQRCSVELEHLSIHDQFGNHIWLYFLEIDDTCYTLKVMCIKNYINIHNEDWLCDVKNKTQSEECMNVISK